MNNTHQLILYSVPGLVARIKNAPWGTFEGEPEVEFFDGIKFGDEYLLAKPDASQPKRCELKIIETLSPEGHDTHTVSGFVSQDTYQMLMYRDIMECVVCANSNAPRRMLTFGTNGTSTEYVLEFQFPE